MRIIFVSALSLPLENKDSVKAAFKNFEERVCCEALQQCASDSQESDALRARFSQLSQDATIVSWVLITLAREKGSDHSLGCLNGGIFYQKVSMNELIFNYVSPTVFRFFF